MALSCTFWLSFEQGAKCLVAKNKYKAYYKCLNINYVVQLCLGICL